MNKKMWSGLLPLLLATGAYAQEAADKSKSVLTPLKVQVVFARYQGEKKVASMPYTLLVTADADERRAPRTHVRMGIQVPLMTQTDRGPTTQYKDVGTNLDCLAESLDDGRFKLVFSLEQTSISPGEPDRKSAGEAGGDSAGPPMFRGFRSNLTMLLRDGQSGQYLSATDPLSGETLKIDVTLNVLK